MKRSTTILGLLLLIGCASAKTAFDPSTMVAASPDAETEYRDPRSVKDIESLSPQLEFPIVLAISQPTSGSGWSAEELELIESWRAPLVKSGFVREMVVLPESLTEPCGWRMAYHCGVRRYRTAAARFKADALLLMAAETTGKSFANPASVLNLTVIGLWLAPAHHRHATTVLEGSLIDNRNEYLYVFARAYGRAKLVRPYIYADWSKAHQRSRQRALETFGEDLIRQVRELEFPSGN